MDKSRDKIDAPAGGLTGGRRHPPEGHPTVEALAAYHLGELAAEARALLQDHLALCDECARLLLDLEGFSDLEPPSEAHRLSDADVEAAKAELRSRIRREVEVRPKG